MDMKSSSLFNNHKYSDLRVKCQDRLWHCHRAIVCPRCPFFEAACRGDFQVFSRALNPGTGLLTSKQEAHARVIILNDDQPESIDMMLRYLYTQKLPDHDPQPEFGLTICRYLFIIGDKYSINPLKDHGFGLLRKRYLNLLEILPRSVYHKTALVKFMYSAWQDARSYHAGPDIQNSWMMDFVSVAEQLMDLDEVKRIIREDGDFAYDFTQALVRHRWTRTYRPWTCKA